VSAVAASAPAIAQGAALLPDLVVVGVAPALRARMEPALGDVPFLLITDPADAEARADLLCRAAQDYVVRPLSPAEIRIRAGNLVAAKRARDLLRRDLDAEALDLESLARACVARRRELAEGLEAACRARERADRLSRTKTAYLRTVGHELAAPLSSLREGLCRLRDGHTLAAVPAAAGHAAALRAIETSAQWIAELGQAMVEFARGEHGGG
jgi:response regulator RpfG family c-di-GMP phosphodiesterase